MSEASYQSTETKPQTIILKVGCWIQTSTGLRQISQEIEAEGLPIEHKISFLINLILSQTDIISIF